MSFSNSSDVVVAGSDPSSMGTKEIREELESLGIGTRLLIEKSELIDTLANARKEINAPVDSGGDAVATSEVDGEGPLCYICLDGPNETDGPLRRDCACRGTDAGYAHLSCLVEFSKSQSMDFNENMCARPALSVALKGATMGSDPPQEVTSDAAKKLRGQYSAMAVPESSTDVENNHPGRENVAGSTSIAPQSLPSMVDDGDSVVDVPPDAAKQVSPCDKRPRDKREELTQTIDKEEMGCNTGKIVASHAHISCFGEASTGQRVLSTGGGDCGQLGRCAKQQRPVVVPAGPDASAHARDMAASTTAADFPGVNALTSRFGGPVLFLNSTVRDQWDGTIESLISERKNACKMSVSWTKCRNCHHSYQHELALDMANECLSFVDMKYSGSQILHLQALTNKLEALAGMARSPNLHRASTSLSPTHMEEAKEIGHNIQELLKLDPELKILFEATTLNSLGTIALGDGTKAGLKDAGVYFEKLLEVYKANGDTEGVLLAEANLSLVKTELGGRRNATEELKRNKDFYEMCVKNYGAQCEHTIFAGVDVAISLSNAYHVIEAERLIIKLADISKRVLGPQHDTTKRAESLLQATKMRYVWLDGDDLPFQACRYENDGEECVIQGPIMTPRSIQDEIEITVPTSKVSPVPGNPVICGLGKRVPHFYGKIGDLRSWNGFNMVYFDDKLLQPCIVPPRLLRIVFDLPPEPQHSTMDFCFHCKQQQEGKSLMVCGRCKYAQYCSKKCQRSHWLSHKGSCLFFEHQKATMIAANPNRKTF